MVSMGEGGGRGERPGRDSTSALRISCVMPTWQIPALPLSPPHPRLGGVVDSPPLTPLPSDEEEGDVELTRQF